MKAQSTYTVKKWDEKTYEKIPPSQELSKASVEFELTGDLSGKLSVEYLTFYKNIKSEDKHNSTAIYIGLIRFVGLLNGKNGSFIMEDHGKYENGTASSELHIIPDSGTDELKGIAGKGNYIANQQGYKFELDYTL